MKFSLGRVLNVYTDVVLAMHIFAFVLLFTIVNTLNGLSGKINKCIVVFCTHPSMLYCEYAFMADALSLKYPPPPKK